MIRSARFTPQRRALILLFSASGGLIGIAAIMAIMAISAGLGATRSVVLDAQATGLEIVFSGQVNDWALGQAILCTPRPQLDLTQARGAGPCDARRYVQQARADLRLTWTQDALVQVSTTEPGGLILDIAGQAGLPDRTRVVLGPEIWQTAGALTFSGRARIGNQLASGETKMVLGGSFELRERPLWSQNTEVLKSGVIRRGESATVVLESDGGATMAEVFGHIAKRDEGKAGFAVGIVSAPGPVVLQLGYFGATKPTRIAPNWIDRALTSPLILALAAVLSILLSAGQVLGNAASALQGAFRRNDPAGTARIGGPDRDGAADCASADVILPTVARTDGDD